MPIYKEKRYAEARKNINWTRDMMCVCLREICPLADREGNLEVKLEEMLPKVTRIVLGKAYTLQEIKDHIWETQGREVTRNRLRGRADSLPRYGECHAMTAAITAAYMQASGPSAVPVDFEKWMVEKRDVEVQGRCEYCDADTHLPHVGQHAEHRISKKNGGRGNYENLAIACIACNLKKNERNDAEFFEFLRLRCERSGRHL